jgi:hypothetical protein
VVHPLVLTDQGILTPSLFAFITFITYLLSSYSCFVLPWVAIAYLSLNLTAPCVLTYQQDLFTMSSVVKLETEISIFPILSLGMVHGIKNLKQVHDTLS